MKTREAGGKKGSISPSPFIIFTFFIYRPFNGCASSGPQSKERQQRRAGASSGPQSKERQQRRAGASSGPRSKGRQQRRVDASSGPRSKGRQQRRAACRCHCRRLRVPGSGSRWLRVCLCVFRERDSTGRGGGGQEENGLEEQEEEGERRRRRRTASPRFCQH